MQLPPIGYNARMRFRPQFSLRTLFVATTLIGMLLGLVGYHLNWIRQRRSFLADQTLQFGDNGMTWTTPSQSNPPPKMLRILGDDGVSYIRLVIEVDRFDAARQLDSYDLVRQAKQLFPESEIAVDFIDSTGSH